MRNDIIELDRNWQYAHPLIKICYWIDKNAHKVLLPIQTLIKLIKHERR